MGKQSLLKKELFNRAQMTLLTSLLLQKPRYRAFLYLYSADSHKHYENFLNAITLMSMWLLRICSITGFGLSTSAFQGFIRNFTVYLAF